MSKRLLILSLFFAGFIALLVNLFSDLLISNIINPLIDYFNKFFEQHFLISLGVKTFFILIITLIVFYFYKQLKKKSFRKYDIDIKSKLSPIYFSENFLIIGISISRDLQSDSRFLDEIKNKSDLLVKNNNIIKPIEFLKDKDFKDSGFFNSLSIIIPFIISNYNSPKILILFSDKSKEEAQKLNDFLTTYSFLINNPITTTANTIIPKIITEEIILTLDNKEPKSISNILDKIFLNPEYKKTKPLIDITSLTKTFTIAASNYANDHNFSQVYVGTEDKDNIYYIKPSPSIFSKFIQD